MKLIRSNISPRLVNKPNKTEGILNYDIDNAYPQRVLNILDSSGAGTWCAKLYSKFIEGGNFNNDLFGKAIINNEKLNANKFKRILAKNFSLFNGFAIHFNYNALYQIVNPRPIPFKDCRLIHPDATEYIGKIAVYNDWGRIISKNIKKDDIQFIDLFNPDPSIIESQVNDAGGWNNYKGQIYWYSTEGQNYPKAPYDSILEDLETDGRIKSHKRKKAATGWNADYLYIHYGVFEGEQERQEATDILTDFQGDEGAGNVMMVELKEGEQKPELVKFEKSDAKGDFYLVNEQSIQANIRKAFGFLPPLVGESTPGKLGIAQELLDAVAFTNGTTTQERNIIQETFEMFIPLMQDKINPSNDFTFGAFTPIVSEATKEVQIAQPTNPPN